MTEQDPNEQFLAMDDGEIAEGDGSVEHGMSGDEVAREDILAMPPDESVRSEGDGTAYDERNFVQGNDTKH
jgi:hypothetical protein